MNSVKCFLLLQAVVDWGHPRARAEVERLRLDHEAKYAGSDELDEQGRRLDDREFSATREALRYVHYVQMGQWRSRGAFHPEVIGGWLTDDDMVRRKLPSPHGVFAIVSDDGQTAYAWRRTISGWHLGISLTVPDLVEQFWAGPTAPNGGPDIDDGWNPPYETPPDWRAG